MTVMPLGVSINDAARMLGVSRGTIYRMIRDGSLVVYRIGDRQIVSVASVKRIVETAEMVS